MRYFSKGYTWGFSGKAGEYQTPEARQSLLRLKEDGVDSLCLAFSVLQDTFASTTIYAAFGRTPTDDDIVYAIRMAKELGMRVCLKPILNCKDGTWRAHIGFPEESPLWETWFASYQSFILHYAAIAQREGCEMFCTGCEMNAMEVHTEPCLRMVEAVRQVYHGIVMHNVNHGKEYNAKWLSALDVIGISAYYPVAEQTDRSKEKMLQKWAEVRDYLRKAQAFYQRPIMFAEIGMRNVTGCACYPWEYKLKTVENNEEEQALFYETALQTFWDEPWFDGFFWWDWPAILYPLSEAPEHTGFCVYGKRAEQVMKRWYTDRAVIQDLR